MPRVEAEVSCTVHDSFRVRQVAGLFDVPLAERATAAFSVEVPGADEDWQIGVIVGPSASGKTTIARRAFGDRFHERQTWPGDRAVIDCFGDLPIKEITGLLTAVGFSSPPAWIKPYGVLSGGQRFRCDLARALAEAGAAAASSHGAACSREPPIVVFDEFTSVVDRTVAQVGSAAVAKAIRGGTVACRFVAVTCHYDVVPWLEPDWVVDMATLECRRRRLWRPTIELDLYRCRPAVWKLFANDHYLTGELNRWARCFVGLLGGAPVVFCATLPLVGRRRRWRITRIVTMSDYQGLGLGMRVAEAVAELHRGEGHRLSVTASHPALIAHCGKSPLWRTRRVLKTGSRRAAAYVRGYRASLGRAMVSFEYVGNG